jgi:hypothetical protein
MSLEATMTPMTIPATDLEPGDRWVSDTGTVVIDGVLRFAADPPLWPRGQVRIYGRILRGVGKGRQTRTWSFQPDQSLDIEREPPLRTGFLMVVEPDEAADHA